MTLKTEKTPSTRAMMWTILLASLVLMPQFAVMPAIDVIATEVFPERSLQSIQTAMSLNAMLSVVGGVASAVLIRYGLMSKKGAVMSGFTIMALAGLTAIFLNTQFWHLGLLSVFVGIGMGTCIPNLQSIMFDNFDEKMRRFMSGTFSAFLNIGGIAASLIGGFLIAIVWYGGYLTTLPALLSALAVFMFLPKDKKIKPGGTNNRAKLPGGVYYHTLLIFLFATLHIVAAMNLSTHLAAGGIGDASTAGIATSVMLVGGVCAGFLFQKITKYLHDHTITAAFFLLFLGFTIFNLFPTSLAMSMAAMVMFGIALNLLMPQCIFNVSNMTEPSNSSTATMFILCIAPGLGNFLSPVIITNLTYALGGDSTRFRYQFTGVICLVVAAAVFIRNVRHSKRVKAA